MLNFGFLYTSCGFIKLDGIRDRYSGGSPLDASPGLKCTKQQVRALFFFANRPLPSFRRSLCEDSSLFSLWPHTRQVCCASSPPLLLRATVEILEEGIIC